MAGSYTIATYFKAGKTYTWAKYVDQKENGGNNNGRVDGKEVQLFKDILKHRYNGFKYDFSRADSIQSSELDSYIQEHLDATDNQITKQLYLDSTVEKGPWALGYSISNILNGPTAKYDDIKLTMKKISEFPVEKKKLSMIKEFLSGYTVGHSKNGFFEQLGSEWGEGVTNGDAVLFLKAIMNSIPEEQRYCDEYGTVQKIYNEYSKKPADEKFKDSKLSFISSMFGLNTLDQLDEAIEKLLN